MTIYNILPVMSQGGTIIEIGAHNGEDTERLYNLIKPDTMIVFEPDPRNYPEIDKRNLPITLIQAAVSNENGTTKLWMSGGKPPGRDHEHTASSSILNPAGHIRKHPDYNFDKQVDVRTVALDEVTDPFNHIKFIWCDAQGSEANIIRGGQKTLLKTEFLFCEYSDEALYEGQMNLEEWMRILPGRWEEVCKWEGDILLKRVK